MWAKRVSGVILAAGPSSRFGAQRPKQLAEIAGQTLVRRTVGRALESSLVEVIVVVGHAAEAVRLELRGLAVSVVENPDFAAGQSGSVKVGLAAVDSRSKAAMFVPIDQPGLTAALIDRLIATYASAAGAIVLPSYGGRRGAPVIVDRSLFAELALISGDEGGRQIFEHYSDRIVELPLSSEESLVDVDREEDLARYRHRD